MLPSTVMLYAGKGQFVLDHPNGFHRLLRFPHLDLDEHVPDQVRDHARTRVSAGMMGVTGLQDLGGEARCHADRVGGELVGATGQAAMALHAENDRTHLVRAAK